MFLRLVVQKTKKEIIPLAEEINCNYNGLLGLLVHNRCMCEFEVFDVLFLVASTPNKNGEWEIAGNRVISTRQART